MNPLYPFESQYLDLDGVRLHYVDQGPRDGDPVVMLHGNPSWSFYYRELIKALRDKYRCIAPDHIGMGLSDKPDDSQYEYTLDRRVADLEKLLGELSNITLVVHDWGGMIGFAYAARHPERIARIVVLNTAAFGLPAGKRLPTSLWLARNTALGALLVRGFNAFARGAARHGVVKPMPPDVRAGYLRPYDSWANRIATLRFVQDIPLSPGDRAYNTMIATENALDVLQDKPMMIAWGAKDFVFDDDFLAQWRDRFPGADVHTFEDAGHYVLEDAGDRIIPLIESFMKRETSP